jgi:hypothetical protein
MNAARLRTISHGMILACDDGAIPIHRLLGLPVRCGDKVRVLDPVKVVGIAAFTGVILRHIFPGVRKLGFEEIVQALSNRSFLATQHRIYDLCVEFYVADQGAVALRDPNKITHTQIPGFHSKLGRELEGDGGCGAGVHARYSVHSYDRPQWKDIL